MKWTEITGVDKNVDFKVKGLSETYRIIEQPTDFQRIAIVIRGGELIGASAWVYDEIVHVAPSGIIHLPPPLTDEQREQLKAIWTLGGRWIAKDKTGNVFAYDTKPQKIMACCHWNNDEDDECFTVMRELSVCSLVSWSDPEPMDIGKALGVEG